MAPETKSDDRLVLRVRTTQDSAAEWYACVECEALPSFLEDSWGYTRDDARRTAKGHALRAIGVAVADGRIQAPSTVVFVDAEEA